MDRHRPVEDSALSKQARKAPQSLFELRPLAEYQHLWESALVGAAQSLGIVEGYANIGVPGDPLPQLQELRDRLDRIITQYEARNE